jgi:hypothetical protein
MGCVRAAVKLTAVLVVSHISDLAMRVRTLSTVSSTPSQVAIKAMRVTREAASRCKTFEAHLTRYNVVRLSPFRGEAYTGAVFEPMRSRRCVMGPHTQVLELTADGPVYSFRHHAEMSLRRTCERVAARGASDTRICN